jgi:hypothetical protein
MLSVGDPAAIPSTTVNRNQKRLFKIHDKLKSLDHAISLVEAELEYHRHIDDDAQRDASIGNYIDREEAKLTASDVRRFEKTLGQMTRKRDKLLAERERLLAGLA